MVEIWFSDKGTTSTRVNYVESAQHVVCSRLHFPGESEMCTIQNCSGLRDWGKDVIR